MSEHGKRESDPDFDPSNLDFELFVAFAQARTAELAPGLDLEAAALIMTLHRAASTVVYDLESSVHRPAGWSWAGSACSTHSGSPVLSMQDTRPGSQA